MAGRVSTRRWNDPARHGEGTRILVTRYRPRGVKRVSEPWDEWHPVLGPSVALHAAYWGKDQPAIAWAAYARRYREEMTEARAAFFIRGLAARVASGEDVALLCSSACTDEACCHRSILRELIGG